MREAMAIFKALADENRIRAVMALRGRELCACHLIELLELAPSTVSRHMSILWNARLVDSRKDGRWMHYRLAGESAPREVRTALAWVMEMMKEDTKLELDERRIKAIVQQSTFHDDADRPACCTGDGQEELSNG